MRKSSAILAAAVATATAFPVFAAENETPVQQGSPAITAKAGQMMYTAAGRPLVPVYRVATSGEPQVIVEGRLLTVPANTLSMSGKKLTTTLTITELRHMAQ